MKITFATFEQFMMHCAIMLLRYYSPAHAIHEEIT